MTSDNSGVPIRTRQFLWANIDSVVCLEALLLLFSNPKREWSAEDVAAELRIQPEGAQIQLDALLTKGLLEHTPSRAFKYAPRTREIAESVESLAQVYSQKRVSLISLIYAKPADPVRDFADAFRLRKRPEDKQDG